MKQPHEIRSICFYYGTLTALVTLILTWTSASGRMQAGYFRSSLTAQRDTVRPIITPKNNLPGDTSKLPLLKDTTPVRVHIDTFSIKNSKDSLDAPVNYEAQDSAVVL